jgi:hypothetical protein
MSSAPASNSGNASGSGEAKRNVIPGFEDLTKEQVIEMAVRHVHRAGRASKGDDGQCSYAGIGCAAAPFLAPEARERFGGGVGWSTLTEMGKVPSKHSVLICRLQDCHDDASIVTGFQKAFDENVAYRFLEYDGATAIPGMDEPWSAQP